MVRASTFKKKNHADSLGDAIESASLAPSKRSAGTASKKSQYRTAKRTRDDEDGGAMDARLASRVLESSRKQQEEEEEEAAMQEAMLGGGQRNLASRRVLKAAAAAAKRMDADDDDEDSDDDSGALGGAFDDDNGDEELRPFGGDRDFIPELDEEVSPADQEALEAFMNANATPAVSLGDLIAQKLAAAVAASKGEGGGAETGAGAIGGFGGRGLAAQAQANLAAAALDDAEALAAAAIDPKVEEVYTAVGTLLTRYTVGKIPKAFKIIPQLARWDEVLWLTRPESWSAHAVFAATRLFASNLNAKMAQRFYFLVLLPRFRRDMREEQKIHFAVYQAIKKAVYKPSAFYRGFLLPLCAQGDCTLREAVVLASVLSKVSIPVLHSSAALLRLCEMPYCGTSSFLMKVLFEKKYALPLRVVDAAVGFFVSFISEERQLPVIWHQTLLSFVQHYKSNLTEKHRAEIGKLCKSQYHYKVTPEVQRELAANPVADAPASKRVRGATGTSENRRDMAKVVTMAV
ncbi:hypothetical protein PPROV_000050500 [Pycnococcus provasolii]|uniref:Bystin n=2 Tax=Pycnococcus provasolii TaxID=41880 RepID=A0A830H552_9CHLO|nr:hypothetical protein PPROV_000050500 [Pycnococcus provasolii]